MKATKKITEPTAPKWIGYVRRSTDKQHITLQKQERTIREAAAAAGAEVIMIIPETESGKERERKGLSRAMAEARRHRATIVCMKHDRLSRDLPFASELVFHSGISFKLLNLPDEAMTDQLLFGVFFGMAAQEAKLISERTKAALAEKKAQGIKLGRPNAAESITNEMRAAAAEVNRRKAEENPNNIAAANEIRRYLADISDRKSRGLQKIADHLTAAGFYTSRGVFHTAKSVDLLCKRFDIER